MSIPYRIHTQKFADECTCCAISAIAENIVQEKINPEFLYHNAKDKKFGIVPSKAIKKAIDIGLQLESGEIIKPFSSSYRLWSFFGWPELFGQAVNILKECGQLFAGCYWQEEWYKSPTVELPSEWKKEGAHAFAIIGTTELNGILYLKVQNSRGTSFGDNGIWYFPREVVNKFSFIYQLS